MKFEVTYFKTIEVEAKDKEDALHKAFEIIDTALLIRGTSILDKEVEEIKPRRRQLKLSVEKK